MIRTNKKKDIKNYASYASINCVLGKNGFTCVKQYPHKINGQRHGFSGFWKNNETEV